MRKEILLILLISIVSFSQVNASLSYREGAYCDAMDEGRYDFDPVNDKAYVCINGTVRYSHEVECAFNNSGCPSNFGCWNYKCVPNDGCRNDGDCFTKTTGWKCLHGYCVEPVDCPCPQGCSQTTFNWGETELGCKCPKTDDHAGEFDCGECNWKYPCPQGQACEEGVCKGGINCPCPPDCSPVMEYGQAKCKCSDGWTYDCAECYSSDDCEGDEECINGECLSEGSAELEFTVSETEVMRNQPTNVFLNARVLMDEAFAKRYGTNIQEIYEFEFVDSEQLFFKDPVTLVGEGTVGQDGELMLTISEMPKSVYVNKQYLYPYDLTVSVKAKITSWETGEQAEFVSTPKMITLLSPAPEIIEMKISPKPVKMHEGPYTVIINAEDPDDIYLNYEAMAFGANQSTTGTLSNSSEQRGNSAVLTGETQEGLFSVYYTPPDFGFNANEAVLAREITGEDKGFLLNATIVGSEHSLKALVPASAKYIPFVKIPYDVISLGMQGWQAWEKAKEIQFAVSTKEKLLMHTDLGLQGVRIGIGGLALIPKQAPFAGVLFDLGQTAVDGAIANGQAYIREAAYKERTKFASKVIVQGGVLAKVIDKDGYSSETGVLTFDLEGLWVTSEGSQ